MLIAFAGWLLDKAESDRELGFADWLRKREIPRLLERTSVSVYPSDRFSDLPYRCRG
jgi:hypothetical protein